MAAASAVVEVELLVVDAQSPGHARPTRVANGEPGAQYLSFSTVTQPSHVLPPRSAAPNFPRRTGLVVVVAVVSMPVQVAAKSEQQVPLYNERHSKSVVSNCAYPQLAIAGETA